MAVNTTAVEFKIITDQKDEPDLESAQSFVGGMVQGIEFPNGDYLIVNEEGKMMGLPLNPEATTLWRATFDNDNFITGRKDFVVGPAILIKKTPSSVGLLSLSTWYLNRGTRAPSIFQLFYISNTP